MPARVPRADSPAEDGGAAQRATEAEALERIATWGDLDPTPFGVLQEGGTEDAARSRRSPARRIASVIEKTLVGLVALWVFLVALALLKDGARGLAPALGDTVSGISNAVGVGWLGALLVLSGSPVAASSLALFDGGFLDLYEAYGMVIGSRLGAAFVVLVVGALYALTGRASGRRAPISIGVLALLMTVVAYLPGGVFGLLILRSGTLDSVVLTPPPVFFDLTRAVTAPVVAVIESVVRPGTPIGAGLLFAGGIALLLVSFRLVDLLLPSLESDAGDARARWYVGPWTMFGIGLVVALATLSVSVALSLLVPAVTRGYLRRDQILPYIAGANITTLADTLLVAVLLDNPAAPRVVVAVAVGISLSTIVLLAAIYRPLKRFAFATQEIVLANPGRLAGFVALLFLCPLALLLVR